MPVMMFEDMKDWFLYADGLPIVLPMKQAAQDAHSIGNSNLVNCDGMMSTGKRSI
jgi:hypothetical protein